MSSWKRRAELAKLNKPTDPYATAKPTLKENNNMGEYANELIERMYGGEDAMCADDLYEPVANVPKANAGMTIAQMVDAGMLTDRFDGKASHSRKKDVTCDICQAKNLHWSMNLGKWRLRNEHGFWHDCGVSKVKLSLQLPTKPEEPTEK